MQMVILAGGLATRLRPLTEKIPKSMLQIHGKPFLQYQIELLKKNGVMDILLCIGYLGNQIRKYFGDGKRFGVSISYSEEGNKLLGTGGALKNAKPMLGDEFFVMYGDSYLMLDYQRIIAEFRKHDNSALMVVYKNDSKYDKSVIAVRDGFVTKYDNTRESNDLVYIDEGVSMLRKAFLGLAEKEVFPLYDLFKALIARRKLRSWETNQRFYEIGSPEGLREFEHLVRSKGG